MELRDGYMNNDLPKIFSEKERSLIITPAGCGKTEGGSGDSQSPGLPKRGEL